MLKRDSGCVQTGVALRTFTPGVAAGPPLCQEAVCGRCQAAQGFCRETHSVIVCVICHEFKAWNLSLELFYTIPRACQKKNSCQKADMFLSLKIKCWQGFMPPVPRPGPTQDKQQMTKLKGGKYWPIVGLCLAGSAQARAFGPGDQGARTAASCNPGPGVAKREGLQLHQRLCLSGGHRTPTKACPQSHGMQSVGLPGCCGAEEGPRRRKFHKYLPAFATHLSMCPRPS